MHTERQRHYVEMSDECVAMANRSRIEFAPRHAATYRGNVATARRGISAYNVALKLRTRPISVGFFVRVVPPVVATYAATRARLLAAGGEDFVPRVVS